MAWSSTGEQTPASSSPIGSPSPSDGVGRAGTFAELLAQRRCGGSDQLIPYALLTPAPCGHCGKIDDVRRARLSEHDTGGGVPDSSTPLDRRVTVSSEASLVEQVAFEGNSCSTCVRMIYRKNRWLDDGGNTPLHYAARCRNLRMLFHFICLVGDEYGHAGAALVLRKLNGRNETALHEAIRLGNKGMAGLLMWVDPELALYPAPGQGTSPLYLAVSLGDELIASMLHRESGGNLAYSGPDGQNALHAAVHHAYGQYVSPDISY
ncbi:hypothetical protein ACQ4PT_020685 [Festuca glaucescens]